MANPFEMTPPDALKMLLMGKQGYDQGKERYVDQARGQAAQELQTNPQSAIARLLQAGDIQGASTIASMGNNQRDFAFRQQEAQRAQGNADRSYNQQERVLEGGKMPAGFERNPAGGLRPIPGGPTDPDYLNAKKPPKELGFGDVSKLAEEGGKFSAVNRFATNFKDEYGGATPGLGDARNWVGRTLPDGMVDPSAREGAMFWQDYDKYKNVVRNDLFGSALTANEQAAFDRADIKNTMAPSVIKANLKTQKDILEGAMKRRASSLVVSGYNPEAISQAYGVPLDQIGVTQTGRSRGSATPAATPSAPPVPGAKQAPDGNFYVPDPSRPGKYLKVN